MKILISLTVIFITFSWGCRDPAWQTFDTVAAENLLNKGQLKDSLMAIDPFGVIYNGDTVMFMKSSAYSAREHYLLDKVNSLRLLMDQDSAQTYCRSRDGSHGMFVLNYNEELGASEGLIYRLTDSATENIENLQFFFQDSITYVCVRQTKKISERWYLFSVFNGRIEILKELFND